MSFHDAYLRLTPFELAFPDGGAEGSVAPESAASLRELGALAFHAVPFRRAGCVTLLLDVELCRFLAAQGPGPAATVTPPAPAGYVQFPRHLVWAQAVPGDPPEPVDGFFWTVGAGDVLHLLLATGIREGRPGLSVVPVAEALLAEAPGWLHARMREAGEDFATTLPGGELRGLYSFVTAGEVLKLAARLFAHLSAAPQAASEKAPALEVARPGEHGSGTAAPQPSGLPYRRVTLKGAP